MWCRHVPARRLACSVVESGFRAVAGWPSAGSVWGLYVSFLGSSRRSWLSYTSSWVGGTSET